MSDIPNRNEKIDEFRERINKRLGEIALSGTVPLALKTLITTEELTALYHKLIDDESLKKEINEALRKGKPFRLAKKNSRLSRTINIYIDSRTQEVCLMLETKSKAINSEGRTYKDVANTPKFSGTSKTAKPAWRIDTPTPIKYANAVLYARTNSKLREASIETSVVQKAEQGVRALTFLNQTAMGLEINESGTRSLDSRAYVSKQPFYSKWASAGDLSVFFENPLFQTLDDTQLNLLAAQLLTAVKTMHNKNLIHQDIKPDNILVFTDTQGNYYLELADFGLTYDPNDPERNKDALATYKYESPEISSINKPNSADWHDYFHDLSYGYDSYARELSTDAKVDPSYRRPHKANDMWSVGVVLHQLYNKGAVPTKASEPEFSRLIKGLLSPVRTNRFTAEQALALLPPPETLKILHEVKPLTQPQFFYLSSLGDQLKNKFIKPITTLPSKAFDPLIESALLKSDLFWDKETIDKIFKILDAFKPSFQKNKVELTEALSENPKRAPHIAAIVVNLINDINKMKAPKEGENRVEEKIVTQFENKLFNCIKEKIESLEKNSLSAAPPKPKK